MRLTALFRGLMTAWIAAAAAASASMPVVDIGFNGYFKQGHPFPVSVSAAGDWELVEIRLLEARYRRGRQESGVLERYRAEADVATGNWRALVFAPRHGRESVMRCMFALPEGGERVVDTPLRGLDSGDALALVITDTPDDFQFVGALEYGRRRVMRCVAGGPALLGGYDWRDLLSLDAVILDGPGPARALDAQALHDWVINGGTVFLTDRALAGDSAWGFADDAAGGVYLESGGEALAGFLDHSDAVLTFRRRVLTDGAFVGLLADDAGVLIGARDKGRGRIVVLTPDWRSLTLRDRALYETVRREIWTAILGLSKQAATHASIPQVAVVPREARVKTLAWPILGFLLACVLLLGPVNRFVLARLKRIEYAIVTLPAGAILLSLAALLAGLFWRPSHVLVEELTVTVADGGDATWTRGMSGVLAPRSGRYAVSTRGPAVLLRESARRSREFGYHDGSDPEVVHTHGRAAAGIDAPAIARWSMRFFETMEIRAHPPVLQASGRVTDLDRVEGMIVNRSTRDIRHAQVVYRQFRVSVGDIAAGAELPFVLDMQSDDGVHGERCRNCGGFHGGSTDPFQTRKGGAPLPDVFAAMGRQVCRWAAENEDAPVVIGMERDPAPKLNVAAAGPDVERRTTHLVAAPLTLHWEEPLFVPDGFAYRFNLPQPDGRRASRTDDNFWQRQLARAPLAFYTHVRAVMAAYMASPELRGETGADGEFREVEGISRMECHILPAFGASSRVRLTWELPDGDPGGAIPDMEPTPAALEVFHWETDSWHELARGSSGTHRAGFGAASGFLMEALPVLVFRQRAVIEPEQTAPDPAGSFARQAGFRGPPALLTLTVAPEGDGDGP